MIIKIDIDDNVNEFDAVSAVDNLYRLYVKQDVRRWDFHSCYAKITQISRAGNIFIKVTMTK